jgi:membrane protein implicated in regulation of membrane protease activity
MRAVVVGSLHMDLIVGVPELPSPGQTLLSRSRARSPAARAANQAVALGHLGAGGQPGHRARPLAWRSGEGGGILDGGARREDWSASETAAGSRSEAMDSIVWIIVAAVLGVAEILTLTAALGLLAVAALVAAGAAALGLGLFAQFATFSVVAIAGLVVVRPLVRRQLRPRGTSGHRFGVAALVGRQARVVQEVTGHAGRVRIGGEEWSARSYDETLVIPTGATVDVIKIEGATALVYPRE